MWLLWKVWTQSESSQDPNWPKDLAFFNENRWLVWTCSIKHFNNVGIAGVSQVYRILQQEETHKQLSKQYNSGPAEPSAFFSSKRDFHNNIESSSSKAFSKYNKNHNNGIKRTFFCDHCKNTGHTINKCYKLYGYPNQNKGKKSTAFACANEESTLPPGMTEDQFSRFLSFMAQEKHETAKKTQPIMLS